MSTESKWIEPGVATTSSSSPPPPPPILGVEDYPTPKHTFIKERTTQPALETTTARKNPPRRNIIRKSEISKIFAVSDDVHSFVATVMLMGARRVTSSNMSVFEALIPLGDRIIDLLPVLGETELLRYLFKHQKDLAINTQSGFDALNKIMNRRFSWGEHPEPIRTWLYGMVVILAALIANFKRVFDINETEQHIKKIEDAIRVCDSFTSRANPKNLDDVHSLVNESRELENNLVHLVPSVAKHSMGKEITNVSRAMQAARGESFGFYNKGSYREEVDEYIATALAFTGMKHYSTGRTEGRSHPWQVSFTWPRSSTPKHIYSIEMDNALKDFHFPFCVDHQNHTLIDAILVHLHSEGRSQDAVTL